MELNGYRLLLPEGTLEYFDLVDVKESVNEVVIYLEEKNTFRIFVHFSFMLSSHFCARFFACPLLLFVSNIVQPLVIVLIIPFLVI